MASTSVAEIKEKCSVKPHWRRTGCFVINPPLKLRCKIDLTIELPSIKEGEIVTATMIDENGMYPNTVHLQEKGYWWNVEYFEIVN